jgi:dTDP-4-amino-4,6-dideoxygalactose transaminase
MPILGWKYNMDNIQAALLIGQLERIEDLLRKRDALWKTYEDALHGVQGIRLLKTRPNVKHARHLFTVLVSDKKRDEILWELQRRNIGVAVNYRPIHLLKYYRDTFGFSEGAYPVAEEIGRRTISLPFHTFLKTEDIQHVVLALQNS